MYSVATVCDTKSVCLAVKLSNHQKMTSILFSVSRESYLDHVSKGFSSFQQNSEFVDMTLAADGHFVKVHQNIVALSSPYLKTLLQSAPCRHPVIFLHNISYGTLKYILEYIYTGEVKIPTNVIDLFVNACKSLCINEINNLESSKNEPLTEAQSTNERIRQSAEKNIAAHIKINTQDNNYNLEVIPNQSAITNNDENTRAADIISNPNNVMTNNDMERVSFSQLPHIPHKNGQRNTESGGCKIVDISNIKNYVILEPRDIKSNTKTAVHKVNVVSNVGVNKYINCNIEELINIKVNADNSQKKLHHNVNSSAISIEENPTQSLIGTDCWQINNVQNISHSESNTDGNNKIVFDKTNCLNNQQENTNEHFSFTPVAISQPKPSQSNLQIELDTNPSQDQTDDSMDTDAKEIELITVQKQDVRKNLKKIRSYMKSKNQIKCLNTSKMLLNKVNESEVDEVPHYTISNRGALQLILHRYMYHNHHHSHGGRKKRWRCIDYRRMHCPAYVDTDNDVDEPPTSRSRQDNKKEDKM